MKLPQSLTAVALLILFALLLFNIFMFFETNRIDLNTSKFESFIGSIKPNCTKAGERSMSNFDMTKGTRDPNIEVINCCLGLKNIADKQRINIRGGCETIDGKDYDLCSPCGNGVCESEYEDRCNCPEDCKE